MSVDRLVALLGRYDFTARSFHAGRIRGSQPVPPAATRGVLHLITAGTVTVHHGRDVALRIAEPSLLLYARPLAHGLAAPRGDGANLVCAELAFDGGATNPLVAALPPMLCLPLSALAGCEPLLAMIRAEAGASWCGRQAVLDRLFEVLFVQLLRHLMETGRMQGGMLAGLSDLRLRRALVAIHESPEKDWSLEALADVAGLSRSAFANAFRARVGETPGAYLARWRIGLAQKLLRQGRALRLVAEDVGYGSEAALSRAFKAIAGLSPRDWRRSQPAA